MLSQHRSETLGEKKNSIKEVVQEIAVCPVPDSFKLLLSTEGLPCAFFTGLTDSRRIWTFL